MIDTGAPETRFCGEGFRAEKGRCVFNDLVVLNLEIS